jgi:hypothetical protein
MSKDYYNIKLSSIKQGEDIKVNSEHNWGSTECLIKFKRSPYVAEDYLVLSEKSIFYDIQLDYPSNNLKSIFTYGIQ